MHKRKFYKTQKNLIYILKYFVYPSSYKQTLHHPSISVLRRAFTMFDSNKSGKIEREKVRLILNTLGYTYDDSELDRLLSAEDTEGKFLI